VADTRFFCRTGPFPLGALAQHVGAELSKSISACLEIDDLASLDAAGARDLSLFCDCTYRETAARSLAGAMITTRKLGALIPDAPCLLYVADPRVSFAHIAYLFYPVRAVKGCIHETAVIDPGATLGQGCRIDAGAKIGNGVALGKSCHVEANAVIGDGVVTGDDCVIGANTTIRNALIGARVRIASNACIGGEGFGFVPTPKGLLRMAQLGRVMIGNDVEIGSNTSIDRGTVGDTVIGAGTVIDNLVQIAHNVSIGRNCVLAGQAGLAGSVTVGDNVSIGGRVAIRDHVTIGSNARIAGGSGVMRNVGEGEDLGGYPAVPIRQWHRQTVGLANFGKKPKGTLPH
jgi:UDP-3-O-[3-hydroxymyristoyl] glucosamine N-acyltransferase